MIKVKASKGFITAIKKMKADKKERHQKLFESIKKEDVELLKKLKNK